MLFHQKYIQLSWRNRLRCLNVIKHISVGPELDFRHIFLKKRFFFWPSRQNPIFRRQNSLHFVVVPLFQQNRREKTLHFSYRVELRTKTPF